MVPMVAANGAKRDMSRNALTATRPAVKRRCGLSSAQWLERRPDLGREQLGLLPGGEVAALAGLVVVGEVWVGLFGPAARGAEDLAGERGEADRELDLRRSLPGRESLGSSALPVRAGGRGPGAGQPVQRDVVEDVVPGEAPGGLP